MNLLAGATGFLGNEILKELGLLEDQTLVLTRRKMDTLPMNTDQLIIDFNKILELELPQIDHVFLSFGFPLPDLPVLQLVKTIKFNEIDYF